MQKEIDCARGRDQRGAKLSSHPLQLIAHLFAMFDKLQESIKYKQRYAYLNSFLADFKVQLKITFVHPFAVKLGIQKQLLKPSMHI